MNTRQILMEQYEDALFAVIMNEIMIEEGKELLEESARLKADPSFTVPEEADQRCLKAIARAFGKQKRAHATRTAWRVFQRVSVAAFVAMLLFTGVYAAFPSVRAATLNLLIEVSDVATIMRFEEDDTQTNVPDESAEARIYEIGELPDDFVLIESGDDRHSYWRTYSNGSGAIITLDVINNSDDTAHRFDTEYMDNVESIEINGISGQLAIKDECIRATLADKDNQVFIDIECDGLSREELLNILSDLVYKE